MYNNHIHSTIALLKGEKLLLTIIIPRFILYIYMLLGEYQN